MQGPWRSRWTEEVFPDQSSELVCDVLKVFGVRFGITGLTVTSGDFVEISGCRQLCLVTYAPVLICWSSTASGWNTGKGHQVGSIDINQTVQTRVGQFRVPFHRIDYCKSFCQVF